MRSKSSLQQIETLTEVSTANHPTKEGDADTQLQNKLPWRVKMVSPISLKPANRNARRHSKKQVRLIKQSFTRYGVINPVVINRQGRIIAGHARVEAAIELAIPLVPVVQIDHLSDVEQRAYALADNALHDKSGWDRGLLGAELLELAELLPNENMDVSLTGFEAAEIDLLLADMTASPSSEAEDVLLELPKSPTSRRGDLWQLGKHRHLCGDSRDALSFKRLMAGARAAAVFTDPPFNRRANEIGGRGNTRHENFAFGAGEMSDPKFEEFLSDILGNSVSVSRIGAVHYVFMDWRHIDNLVRVGRALYGAMLNLVVWNKTNAGQGSFYRSQHELIAVFRVGDVQHRNNVELGRHGRNRSNVWTYPGVNTFGRGRAEALASHPTVKPVALVADALLDCTARGDAVLDPFMGSGTTLLAAEKVGRVSFGIEYEPAYVDVAIMRWQAVTKLEATLAGDGRTFEEIAASRSAEAAHG